jgi:hypothetical protein
MNEPVGGPPDRLVNAANFKSLDPHRCGLESRQGLWIPSSASLQKVRSTQGLPPPEKLEIRQYDLHSAGVTSNQTNHINTLMNRLHAVFIIYDKERNHLVSC